MRISWSNAARGDLRTISDYLSRHDKEVAMRMLRAIRSHAALLEQFPALGSAVNQSVRRLSVRQTPYLIIYAVRQDSVFVVRIFDSRQDWQNWVGQF